MSPAATAPWRQAILPALLYCLGFALLRLWLTPVIGVDDVEQIIVTQDWRLGYMPKQPPLYSWILRAVADVLGDGLAALVATKYLLLFATLVFTHRAAALLLRDGGMALLATGSLALFYLLGYQAHIGFTHTAALMAVTAVSLWLLLELCRRPTAWRYAAFGVALGLGLLSKYNFAGIAAAMLLAAWMDGERRPALRDRRMLLVPAAAAAVFAPYGAWLLLHAQETAALYSAYVAGGSAPVSPLAKRLGALAALLKACAEFLPPFVPLVPALYYAAFGRRGWRATWRASADLRFLAWMIGGGLALLALLAVAGGTRMVERYMVPYLMASPMLLLALVQARLQVGAVAPEQVARARRRHGWLILALILAAAIGLALSILRTPPKCGHCRLQKPFTALAERLAGHGPGTLIAGDEFIGGNLAPRLGLRTYSLAYPGYAPRPAPPRDGVCLLVWDATAGAEPPAALRAFAERIRDAALPAELAAERLELPYVRAPQHHHAWYAVFLPPAGDCR